MFECKVRTLSQQRNTPHTPQNINDMNNFFEHSTPATIDIKNEKHELLARVFAYDLIGNFHYMTARGVYKAQKYELSAIFGISSEMVDSLAKEIQSKAPKFKFSIR